MSWYDDAIADVKRDEGCSLTAYQDQGGVWTIGYGHTAGVKEGDIITQATADFWLARDIDAAEQELLKLVDWFATSPETVRRGLLNMCFNLGWPKLSQFTKMLAAGAAGSWGLMGTEALNSVWALQVGDRAGRIAKLFYEAENIVLGV